jgi:hypothetical protein
VLGLIPGDQHTVSATIGIAVTRMSAEGSVDAARSPLSAMMEASAGSDAATNRWEIYTTRPVLVVQVLVEPNVKRRSSAGNHGLPAQPRLLARRGQCGFSVDRSDCEQRKHDGSGRRDED